MTAISNTRTLPIDVRPGGGALLGFGTFFRKELADWVRGRRLAVVAIASTAFAVLGALSAWLDANVGDLRVDVGGDGAAAAVSVASIDPTVTTLALLSTPIVAMTAIFATMSLVAGERDSGTLAWALTKPLSRTAVLLAKWSAALVAFGFAAVLVPIAAAAIASTVAYGSSPDPTVVVPITILSLAVPILYVSVTIAAGTVVSSQAGVAGIGFGLLFLPALIGGFLPPAVVEAMPTGIGSWVQGFVTGEPVPWSTPVAWAVMVVILALVSLIAFRRREF